MPQYTGFGGKLQDYSNLITKKETCSYFLAVDAKHWTPNTLRLLYSLSQRQTAVRTESTTNNRKWPLNTRFHEHEESREGKVERDASVLSLCNVCSKLRNLWLQTNEFSALQQGRLTPVCFKGPVLFHHITLELMFIFETHWSNLTSWSICSFSNVNLGTLNSFYSTHNTQKSACLLDKYWKTQ